MKTKLTRLKVPLALLAAAALAAGCGSASGSSGKLSLIAYSTPKEAYAALIPAFERTPAGKGVGFASQRSHNEHRA